MCDGTNRNHLKVPPDSRLQQLPFTGLVRLSYPVEWRMLIICYDLGENWSSKCGMCPVSTLPGLASSLSFPTTPVFAKAAFYTRRQLDAFGHPLHGSLYSTLSWIPCDSAADVEAENKSRSGASRLLFLWWRKGLTYPRRNAVAPDLDMFEVS